MKQLRDKIVSTLLQSCFKIEHQCCINVVLRWKSDVEFVSFLKSGQRCFNVDPQLWNNVYPTLKYWLGIIRNELVFRTFWLETHLFWCWCCYYWSTIMFILDLFLYFKYACWYQYLARSNRIIVNTIQQSTVFHLTKCRDSTLYSMLLFLLLLIVFKEFSSNRDLILGTFFLSLAERFLSWSKTCH